MDRLFDDELTNVSRLRTRCKQIGKTLGLSHRQFYKDVLTAMEGDLGTVWARRRNIKRVLAKYGVNDQRSDQWLAKRGLMITASEVTGAFKTASPSARYELLMRKIVGPKPQSADRPKALIWGTQMEPIAKEIYGLAEGAVVVDTSCVTHPVYPFLGASPDGIVLTTDTLSSQWGKLVEIKCPYSRIFNDDTPIPDSYWHQMQMQMECTRIDTCDYVEFRFTSPSYSKWAESTATKSFYVSFDNGELMYKPINADPTTWIQTVVRPRSSEFRTTYWILEKWRKVVVPRDFTWMNTHLGELTEFWDDVQKYRSTGTVPTKILPPPNPNSLWIVLSDEQNTDSPGVQSSTPQPAERPPADV
jgi:putative phage-type endonuclease